MKYSELTPKAKKVAIQEFNRDYKERYVRDEMICIEFTYEPIIAKYGFDNTYLDITKDGNVIIRGQLNKVNIKNVCREFGLDYDTYCFKLDGAGYILSNSGRVSAFKRNIKGIEKDIEDKLDAELTMIMADVKNDVKRVISKYNEVTYVENMIFERKGFDFSKSGKILSSGE